jgi:radical SAM superfamily enzyme YgiQ (UPF0313 family)
MAARIAVIDPGYKDPNHLGLGATWLRWSLENSGVPLVEPREADILLASVQSQQSFPQLRTALRRYGVRKGTKIVLGGPGCYGPAVFDDAATVCCVGEGPSFLRTLLADGLEAVCELPQAWVPGQTREVIPDSAFPWSLPPIMFQDGFARVWASRGCKRNCLFCQTGWEQPYRENPDMEAVCRQARELRSVGTQVCVSTNDASELDWDKFPPAVHFSATVDGMMRLLSSGAQMNGRVKSVRLGVEGMSERLRSAVGKPVADAELIGLSKYILDNGVGVSWFFVCGLPCESEADYDGLRRLVSQVKSRMAKGVVMMRFHAYIPQPAAPLSLLPLRDDYWQRLDEFRRWFFHGPGLTARVQIIAPSQPAHRLKDARLSMACDEPRLRSGWADADPPNWRVRYMGTREKRRQLAERYAATLESSGTPFPSE